MMYYRVEQEIMAAYKHVDYQQNNIVSIDMVAIYQEQKLIKLHQNCKIDVIDIPARDYDDCLFNDTNEFYTRIFSQISEMVTK